MKSENDAQERRQQVTLILHEAAKGEGRASSELLPIVYDELRRLARWHLSRERPGQTLQPTALVHEAYLRLLGNHLPEEDAASWDDRRHFFAAAAEAMRRILIERARRSKRIKHGAHLQKEDADVLDAFADPAPESDLADVISLDAALSKLEQFDSDAALVTKLRHYSGFTIEEISSAIGKSSRSVDRKWALARAWLLRELAADSG